jgi:non-heme chloroperoxidase
VLRIALVLACGMVPVLAAQPAWRDPSPHQVRFVTVDTSVKLEVLDWGGTGRPLVFVSCYLTGHAYDDIAPKLTDRFHVYGYTRRGFGASDRPAEGYELQRSVDDLLGVLDALKMNQPILVANSCGGWTLTRLAVQHPARLGGAVYLEAADDPMLTLADYKFPPVDEANLPKRANRPEYDYSSFDAYRRTQKARAGVTFPEAELRYQFSVKPDGSLGPELMSRTVRRAITTGARAKQDYAHVRVPVLAIFGTQRPFEEIARGYVIQNDLQRTALRQQIDSERIMTARWENDLRAALPNVKIAEFPGASLYMFLSNEADVIRELRAFGAALDREKPTGGKES